MKKKIISNTKKIILKDGIEKFTLKTLSENMRISKKTLYRYFKSKEELVTQLYSCMLEDAYTDLISIIQSKSTFRDKFQNLSDIIEDHVLFFNENHLSELNKVYPSLVCGIKEFKRERVFPLLSFMIRIAQKRNIIKNYDRQLLIQVFFGTLNSITDLKSQPKIEFDHHTIFRETFGLVLNGVLTKKGKNIFKQKSNYN